MECALEYLKKEKASRLDKYTNPIYKDLKCGLLNSKKTDFYTFDSPEWSSGLDPTGLDLSRRGKCCRCVSFALYFARKLNYNLYMFLASVMRSVENVKKYLPDWIVRLYLDPSIFKQIIGHSEKTDDVYQLIVSALDSLFKAKNVEIYTYFCDSAENINNRRTYRFMPMIDPTVASYAIRDADGIVTVVDCNNLDCMVKNQTPLYIIPLAKSIPCLIKTSYQKWLEDYKEWDPYYREHGNVIDLLAGNLAGQVKFTADYYYECMEDVFKFIATEPRYNFALDEILLLRLFRNLICVPYVNQDQIRRFRTVLADDLELKLRVGKTLDLLMKARIFEGTTFQYQQHHHILFDVNRWNVIKDDDNMLEEWRSEPVIPDNLLLCTVEEFKKLYLWFEEVTADARDEYADNSSAVDYLRYQMIERVISPTGKYMILTARTGSEGSVSSNMMSNSSHIKSWCHASQFNSSCKTEEMSIMTKIRIVTKHLVGSDYSLLRDIKFGKSVDVDKIRSLNKYRTHDLKMLHVGHRMLRPDIIEAYQSHEESSQVAKEES